MEHNGVLTDTSIIIDFLRKSKKEDAALWKIRDNNECFMSSVTLFELYCGAKTEKHFEDIEKLRRWIPIISFHEEIAEASATIYKELKKKNTLIEFRDIFIAATAVVMNIPVATLNTKHFERIDKIIILTIY